MSETTTTPELETLLVQSKVREEVRKRAADLRVSEDFLKGLNEEVHNLIAKAIKRCNDNKRKTLGSADV